MFRGLFCSGRVKSQLSYDEKIDSPIEVDVQASETKTESQEDSSAASKSEASDSKETE